MADAVVLGVTGIVVSGVVGPSVAALLARMARTREFDREQISYRRDQLRGVLDEAAVLLASAGTNLRLLQESASGTQPDQSWVAQVFPIGQRLQLWVASDHPVVLAYERVRSRLIAAAEVGVTTQAGDDALDQFELDRTSFLDAARQALVDPFSGTGGLQ